MDTEQRKQVEDIAELKVRRYFDEFEARLADRLKGERNRTHMLIEAHDTSSGAHGGVERRFSRMVWVMMGLSAGGGGTLGAGLMTLVQHFLG